MRFLSTFFMTLLLVGITLPAQEVPSQQPESEPAIQGASSEEQEAQRQEVRSAQQVLQERGFYSGAIDGIAGPQTEAAVRQFQESQKLEATGKLDDETLKRLGLG